MGFVVAVGVALDALGAIMLTSLRSWKRDVALLS